MIMQGKLFDSHKYIEQYSIKDKFLYNYVINDLRRRYGEDQTLEQIRRVHFKGFSFILSCWMYGGSDNVSKVLKMLENEIYKV